MSDQPPTPANDADGSAMALTEQIHQVLAQLTLAEKAMLCSGRDFWHLPGVERLDLPPIMLTDGPHGLRKQSAGGDHVGLLGSVPATCFPTAAGLASSWNRELLEQVGTALGQECRREGVSVLLGPGINIKRNPLGGRNFEYFSEDPYVSGQMAAAWVRGVQGQHVGTSLKHYAVNNHESGRMVVDVIVDERTLREIYLPGFETTVSEAEPWTIMCSYNKVNGAYLSENRELLTTILRDEWGYSGMVVSDWGAANDRVLGIRNGLNLEMPASGQVNTRRIIEAVESGSLRADELDSSVARVLELMLKSRVPLQTRPACSMESHHALARRSAEEACVLLKNEGQLLPLETQQNLAVIGALAARTRYQGSGSSQINPTRLEQPLEEIIALVGDQGSVQYAEGYPQTGPASAAGIAEALNLAQDCDRVILIVGLTPEFESEGFDRADLRLPESQLVLIEALQPVYDKLVVVLQNGAPVELPFANKVPAIVEAYLGGQAGASALANILFGKCNPSGKLAETLPLTLADVPSQPWFPGKLRQSQYREGIWVGYRYYDSADVPVAFPFGHGLSYTHFEYSALKISGQLSDDGTAWTMSDTDTLDIEFTVTNTGDRAGAEIAQIYIGQRHSSVHRPRKELKQFCKLFLQPGESASTRVTLDRRAFAWWHNQLHGWVVESDDYDISVGACVSDIRLQQRVSLQTSVGLVERDPALSAYFMPGPLAFDDAAFEALLGHPIPAVIPARPVQLNSTLSEVQDTWVGRQLMKTVNNTIVKMAGGELGETEQLLVSAITAEMPLRNLVTQSQGKLTPAMMRAMIHIMNHNWLGLLRATPVESR